MTGRGDQDHPRTPTKARASHPAGRQVIARRTPQTAGCVVTHQACSLAPGMGNPSSRFRCGTNQPMPERRAVAQDPTENPNV